MSDGATFAQIIDAEWFADHPDQRTTVRGLIPGEFGPEVDAQLGSGPHMVVVIRDTVRVLARPIMLMVEEDQQ